MTTANQFVEKAKQVHGQKKVAEKTPLQIHEEAAMAASKAANDFIKQHGEPFYCGFAWVNINNGRSAFARALSKAGIARKSYDKGLDVWNPCGSMTQSMVIKEEGARAYAEVLRKYGIEASARSRPD